MNTQLVLLPLNIVLSTLIFLFAYLWLVRPALPRIGVKNVIMAILLLHSLRHLGLMFISIGAALPGIPWQFAWPAATGDFIAASLSFIAAFLLQKGSPRATTMIWIATVFGLADFTMAIALSNLFLPAPYLGAAYWIPAFWVPMLVVGHIAVIDMLRAVRRAHLAWA
jgi:hypothetical protein